MLIATGVSYRQLDARRASTELTGAGVYYGAAMTEARSCAQQDVVVVGGANSAGQAAVYFARLRQPGDDARARRPSLEARCRTTSSSRSPALPNIEVRTRQLGDRGATATTGACGG